MTHERNIDTKRLERIHRLCSWLLIPQNKRCERCNCSVETSIGQGTPGCFALAEEAYEIAHGTLTWQGSLSAPSKNTA